MAKKYKLQIITHQTSMFIFVVRGIPAGVWEVLDVFFSGRKQRYRGIWGCGVDGVKICLWEFSAEKKKFDKNPLIFAEPQWIVRTPNFETTKRKRLTQRPKKPMINL